MTSIKDRLMNGLSKEFIKLFEGCSLIIEDISFSPDHKLATVWLNKHSDSSVVASLNEKAKDMRLRFKRTADLKYCPKLKFCIDVRQDLLSYFDALNSSPN